jgi:hypothetical protein
MATYPLSDGTNSRMVLYPAGVTSFNEDYQETENFRESDTLTRFNSIVKTSGIVAKKADIDVKLFPTVVSGNQISISAGVGYTGNGAEINIQADLTIADITALTGYVAPSGSNSVYLVLRKYAQDYNTRPHPIKGTQHYTRRRIKSDSSIVEFVVKSGADRTGAITDRDVIVLGKLTSVSPAVFDTTEKVGFRKILRVTETPTMETGILNTMENDIDLVNQYNILNSPQFGEDYYKLNGVVNNKDFQRLIAKTTSQLSVLRGVKFQAVTGGYGIQFANDTSIKIKIFPAQQPPQTIDIIQQNTQVAIPENSVMYVTLSDAQLLITSGGGGTPVIEGDSAIGGGGVAGSFSTADISSSNLGTTVGSNLRKFPICWHYYNANTAQRSLIFLDGTVLNLNDEVTTEGYHSAYLRRAGVDVANNYMTGNIEIRKNSGKLILTQGSEGVLLTNITTGIEWRKAPPFNDVVIGEFKRFISGNTGGEDTPPSGIEDYDFYLNAFDNDGLNGKSFVFKKDGRIQIDTPARSAKDVLRLNEGFDKRGDDVANNVVTGNITIAKNNPQLILQDTTSTSGFQGLQFKKADGGGIGYFERQSEAGTDTVFPSGWDTGDWLWATTDNNGLNGKGVRLSVNTGHLVMPKLLVQTDGTINNSLTVGLNNTPSGNYAFAQGRNNTVSGTEASALGVSNNVSGTGSHAQGSSNTVSGLHASADGVFNTVTGLRGKAIGNSNDVDGEDAIAIGVTSSAYLPAQMSHGEFGIAGLRTQYSRLIGTAQTVNPTTLTANIVLQGGVKPTIPVDTTWMFSVKILARRDAGADNACFQRYGIITNNGGTTALVGSVTTLGSDLGNNAGAPPASWAVAVTADNTNDALQIACTQNGAGNDVLWVAIIDLVEITQL